jgi:hypothetical protein
MKLHQLSVFLENKPGQLLTPCKVLAAAGVNIVTMSLADTQQFGILRLLVAPWEQAKAVLEKAGCVVNVTEVVALPVPFHPGGLAGVLEVIEHAGISVEYMYAMPGMLGDQGVLIFRFEDTDTAVNALRSSGVKPLEAQTLWKRLNLASSKV